MESEAAHGGRPPTPGSLALRRISINRQKLRSWALILVTFGAALWMVVLIGRNRTPVEAFIRNLGPAGPVISLVLYAVLGLSPLPADPLTIINGAVYGPVVGALVAWAGTTISALIEYFIGARLGEAVDFEARRAQMPDWMARASPNSIWFLLGGRMLTGVGSKIVSFLSGAYRVPLRRFLWTTLASTLFGAVVYALSGYGLLNLF